MCRNHRNGSFQKDEGVGTVNTGRARGEVTTQGQGSEKQVTLLRDHGKGTVEAGRSWGVEGQLV